MEEPLPVREGVTIPGTELRFTASRSGGPGGQHVNKTSSKVNLHWDVANTSALSSAERDRVMRRLGTRINAEGILTVAVDTERSQHQNREIARERLARLVREALREPKVRVPTKASLAAKRRRVEEKSRRAALKRNRRDPGPDA